MSFQPDLFRPANADILRTEKGHLGEDIIKNLLIKSPKVAALYQPADITTAHPFDLIVDLVGGNQILVDVKTYASRSLYRDTGINISHKEMYLQKQREYRKPFFIIFVDDLERRIYGGYLNNLLVPYTTDPRRGERGRSSIDYPSIETCGNGKKIYFSLDSMTHLAQLSDYNIKVLSTFSTGAYRYLNGK